METISNMTSTYLWSTYSREGKNTQPVLTLNPNITLLLLFWWVVPPPPTPPLCFLILSFYTLSADVSSRRFVTPLPKYVRVRRRDKKQKQEMESLSCGSQTGRKRGHPSLPARHMPITHACTPPVLSDVCKHNRIRTFIHRQWPW